MVTRARTQRRRRRWSRGDDLQRESDGDLCQRRADGHDGLDQRIPDPVLSGTGHSEQQAICLVPLHRAVRTSIGRYADSTIASPQTTEGRDRRGGVAHATPFLLTIFTLFDLGYVMYVHQTLAERARAAARYGSLNPTDTTGMKNIAIYYETTGSGAGVLGLTTSNVTAVRSGADTTADRVTVTI